MPIERLLKRGLLVADGHQAECVCRMRGPVMLGTEADVAGVVPLLVIPAKGISTGLCGRFVEPAPMEYATDGFDTQRRRTPSLVCNGGVHSKTGVPNVIFISLSYYVVLGDTIMWQSDNCVLVA